MNTNSIIFKGPFHFDHIKSLASDNTKKGIYIWGFVYKFNHTQNFLNDPIRYKKNGVAYTNEEGMEDVPSIEGKFQGIDLGRDKKFIPYYVGKAYKTNLFKRLTDHHKLTGDTMKKIRFCEQYMKSFFLGKKGFPIHYCEKNKHRTEEYNTNVENFVKSHKGSVAYFNTAGCLEEIYKKAKALKFKGKYKDWPIKDQYVDGNPIDDILEKLIDCYNNFWFCYATIDPHDPSINFDVAEANTFWALKGQTISQIAKTKECVLLEAEDTCKDIFKYKNGEITADIPPLDFPAHGKDTLFPGYIDPMQGSIAESISHDLVATTPKKIMSLQP